MASEEAPTKLKVDIMVDALEQVVSTIKEPLQTTDMEEVLAVLGTHIRLPIALAPMQA